MESHNINFSTVVKDTDHCLIHKAASDFVLHGNTILTKYLAEFKEQQSETIGHNIQGICWRIKK